ncbi:MAG: hypothetical protein CMN44_03740 [SAR116 cluster bacterium]|nr:hypothetical protein [SAR116 cluster bacterium]RPH10838.1 MAG: DUF1491 family protein [Alphaproteobacteria bacterium TMED54]|tara:strand:+ start:1583 stop:1927 length:345 start_codon:yes stop_codon:yes gene_type:complete
MEDILKSELIIKSVTRIAQREGVPIFILKKGDFDSGIILIKIDLLNGKGRLLRRNLSYSLDKDMSFVEFIKLHDSTELVYSDLNKLVENEVRIDPDIWVVEIEDKKGRNFFEYT